MTDGLARLTGVRILSSDNAPSPSPSLCASFFFAASAMKNTITQTKGFTLVELMVVVAIIGILDIIALPAYNNYSTKSKFTEVVLATAPTKTAISTCAVSGDCVASGAISLGTAAAADPNDLSDFSVTSATPNAANSSAAAVFAGIAAYRVQQGYTVAQAQAFAPTFASTYGPFFLNPGPGGSICLRNVATLLCQFQITPSYIPQFNSAALNPYYAAFMASSGGSSGSAANLPCVGNSASGCSPSTKYVATVSYDATGIITATAQTTSGLNAETFVLIPALSGGRVDWSPSGTCKTRAGGSLC